MNKNIQVLSIAIVAIVIGSALLFFTKEEKPKEEIVLIRILDSSTTINSWEIVKKLTERDILEEEGIKLELITNVQSAGGTTQLQALMAKNIDYGSSRLSAWVNAIAAGGKIKVVLVTGNVNKDNPGIVMVVLKNSSIFAARDLIGKKIAINVLGAAADYDTRFYLKKNGFSIEQVQLVLVPYTQMEQALRSGQVDVAYIFDKNLLGERGGYREIPGTREYELGGQLGIGGGGFRDDFIKDHPETVKRFVTAFEKSQRLVWEEYQKDPERVKKAAAEIMVEKGGNPKEARYYVPTYDPEYPFNTDKNIQELIDLMLESSVGNLKPGQIKPSDIYTNEFNLFINNN